ncbi:MAG: Flp pilus assembly complex ATPase component TadA [Candidatus Sumerlaeaceae bacterium]|nr:Flp pilus assembly complex ATPase component TadA [Candidatus Sumerlaeaceae bacterium]
MSAHKNEQPTLKLGEALIKEGVISKQQLQYALQLQQESPGKKRIGDILLQLNYCTKRQLREISKKYNHRLQIGQLLVDCGLVTEEQVQAALEQQLTSKLPLGEILTKTEVVTDEQLAQAISQQLDYPYIVPHKRLVDRNVLKLFSAPFLKMNSVLPMFKDGDVVTVVVSNPLDQGLTRMLDKTLSGNYDLAIAPKAVVDAVLNDVLTESTVFSSGSDQMDTAGSTFQRYDLRNVSTAQGAEQQVINIVDYILSNAVNQRASDIHIDSMYNKIRVRHRVDGKLVFETDLPRHIGDRMIRRIKVLANIDVTDSSETADGHIHVTMENQNVDLRVSLFQTVLGVSITIRALTRDIGLKDLSDLGMLPTVLTTLKLMLDSPSGFILFAGPTGSGKTTSLYACLNYLNESATKIVTIESPVEYSIEGIAQSQVKNATSQEMSDRIKAMMHQDPDVIVLGEIADEATAAAVAQAALSGHKVFSTIHADDSIGAIQRLMEMGLKTYLLSSTGVAAISQRLVRQICIGCKEPFTPSRDTFKLFKLKDFDVDRCDFYHGKGCPRCNRTGYLGRTGIYELLALTDDIRNSLLENRNASVIRRVAEQTEQYISLRAVGFIKAIQGETTLDEVLGMLSYSEQQSFGAMGLTEATINYWMGKAAPQ